ncbi:MAG: T9SS type A sorting domain-containing protein [Candidatus Latescibacteria bacterium]|nr:T9SS type A sorting domain-containing protein [Candidatus Latescibacterota bacterium]
MSLDYNGTNHYLNFVNSHVYDAAGNNNGRLDPGETANLTSVLRNIGGANFTNLQTTLICTSPYITITDNSGHFGVLAVDSIKENIGDPYAVSVNPNCPQGHNAVFQIIATDGAFADTFTFSKVVGSYHYLVWNPDPTPASGQTINNILTTNGYSGAITTNLLAEPTLDLYRSIFICCGIYPNNYRIVANGAEATAIVNYLNNGGRVWLEGGDVWYYDPLVGGHNFGTMFGLVGLSDGSGDMGPVIGVANTFTNSMNFGYSGENSYMDRINATTGYLIFQDGNNSYNCGVAHAPSVYRTIGVSFEFGSLVDGAATSTKRVLIDSIMEFFGITLTGIEESGLTNIELYPSLKLYPNPVKAGNQIRLQYTLPNAAALNLRIYNTLGSCVRTIKSENNQNHTIVWNGTDEQNRKLPAGVYFMSMEAENAKKITRRIVLID